MTPRGADPDLIYLRLPAIEEGEEETSAKNKKTSDDKKPFFSTLEPGKNYGLCVVEPPPKDSKEAPTKHCLRFSVHTPFFYFPHDAPKASADNYTDPDPFVVIDHRVAIFGVVDPELAGQVGILNFGWQHRQDELTSRVSVEDPAEALRQQLDYFNEVEKNFTGLKILLAQTNPQRARALASKFPEFQMVVSGADKEQATSDVELSSTWDTNRRKRAFVAVPAPYYNAEAKDSNGKPLEGSVYFGTVTASPLDSEKWKLASATNLAPIPIKGIDPDPATGFWDLIKTLPGCLPKHPPKVEADNQSLLKWLVLCSIRDYTSADVALIQRRDLFDRVSQADTKLLARAAAGLTKEALYQHIQQTLDSLIWKGDLVTLLYVPGSAIKNALKKSATYESEEKSSLSLVSDKDRQLETLGIREEDGEYFINDLPLDENRIYAVATTDYIGAGDTGYPDLESAALNPRAHPAAFTGKLVPISGLVCSKLFKTPDEVKKYCLASLESSKYLDETTAQQIPPYKAPGFSKKLGDFFKSGLPAGTTEAETVKDAIEYTVHRREIWKLSLEKFSFGFKGLSKNLSDKEVGEKFEGIPVSGVTATESETYDVGLSTRLSRSSHKRELYIQTGLEFERNSTGDTPSAFQISQAKNRLFSETGLVVWRTPGRSLPNLGLNFSIYAETQVTRPFSDFDLTSGDKIRITQNRSLQLLPRFGLRWQGLANSAEIGIQAGEEINALSGYQFTTPGGVVECLAKDAPSFSKCIADNSDPDKGGLITKDTPHSVVADDRPRAGMYWKVVLSRPITSKIKYELEDTGDFFFVNFGKDTTVDTRLRIIQKHRLSFVIWPSVTIGPALDLLIYQNKVNRDLLFQRQFGFETNISFDIFNRRERGVQLKHKP